MKRTREPNPKWTKEKKEKFSLECKIFEQLNVFNGDTEPPLVDSEIINIICERLGIEVQPILFMGEYLFDNKHEHEIGYLICCTMMYNDRECVVEWDTKEDKLIAEEMMKQRVIKFFNDFAQVWINKITVSTNFGDHFWALLIFYFHIIPFIEQVMEDSWLPTLQLTITRLIDLSRYYHCDEKCRIVIWNLLALIFKQTKAHIGLCIFSNVVALLVSGEHDFVLNHVLHGLSFELLKSANRHLISNDMQILSKQIHSCGFVNKYCSSLKIATKFTKKNLQFISLVWEKLSGYSPSVILYGIENHIESIAKELIFILREKGVKPLVEFGIKLIFFAIDSSGLRGNVSVVESVGNLISEFRKLEAMEVEPFGFATRDTFAHIESLEVLIQRADFSPVLLQQS